ncbi:MAG: LLM class flavin-dependent oxidoreductase [Actinomycetota bacterium]
MPSNAAPRLRILQVITDTDRRGAQVFATDLGVGLDALGHDVTTVALAPGTRTPALAVAVLGRRARGFATLRALHRAMRDADVTVAHGSSTLLACGLAGGGRARPFVYRQISDSRFWAAAWHRRARVALYLRQPRHIVALSQSAKDTLAEYLRVQPGKVTVVPNGVPASAFTPPAPEVRAAARLALGLTTERMVALYVGGMGARGRNFYNDLMCRYGYEAEAKLIQDLYLDGKKDEAAAAVPAEFLKLINLCGPEGWVKERIAAFAESGVTVLNVVPVGGNPLETLEKLKDWTS